MSGDRASRLVQNAAHDLDEIGQLEWFLDEAGETFADKPVDGFMVIEAAGENHADARIEEPELAEGFTAHCRNLPRAGAQADRRL